MFSYHKLLFLNQSVPRTQADDADLSHIAHFRPYTGGSEGKKLRKEESEPFDPDTLAHELTLDTMKLKLKEFDLKLKKEGQLFTTWLDMQMNAERSRQQLEYKLAAANTQNLNQALKAFTANAFTVQIADSIAKGAAKASVSLRTSADYYAKGVDSAYKLHIVNTTYLGAMSDPDLVQLAEHIKSTVLTDVEKVAFVIILSLIHI